MPLRGKVVHERWRGRRPACAAPAVRHGGVLGGAPCGRIEELVARNALQMKTTAARQIEIVDAIGAALTLRRLRGGGSASIRKRNPGSSASRAGHLDAKLEAALGACLKREECHQHWSRAAIRTARQWKELSGRIRFRRSPLRMARENARVGVSPMPLEEGPQSTRCRARAAVLRPVAVVAGEIRLPLGLHERRRRLMRPAPCGRRDRVGSSGGHGRLFRHAAVRHCRSVRLAGRLQLKYHNRVPSTLTSI